jgi:hypothetical protein
VSKGAWKMLKPSLVQHCFDNSSVDKLLCLWCQGEILKTVEAPVERPSSG